MKIGIAIAGCGMGGVAAFCALKELENIGIHPQFLSGSVSGVAGLLAASCGEESLCAGAAREYLHTCKADAKEEAIRRLCAQELMPPNCARPLICYVNTQTAQWKACGFGAKHLEELCCAAAGLTPYKGSDGLCCDFSSYYGCPLFPLKAAGADKVIALVYQPARPMGPWETCRQKLVELTAETADCMMVFPDPACRMPEDFLQECAICAKKQVEQNMELLLDLSFRNKS